MTSGPALSCPTCKRRVRESDWIDDRSCSCGYCRTYFEGLTFPAARCIRAAAKPQTVVLAEESTCFFHAQNQAEKLCQACGRFLCSICAIPMPGELLCPLCIVAKKTKSPTIVAKRVLFDAIALAVAVLPILLWIFTLVTAPIALILVIYGWKKPGSLVHGRRTWRMVLAGLVALIQIAGWFYLGMQFLLR